MTASEKTPLESPAAPAADDGSEGYAGFLKVLSAPSTEKSNPSEDVKSNPPKDIGSKAAPYPPDDEKGGEGDVPPAPNIKRPPDGVWDWEEAEIDYSDESSSSSTSRGGSNKEEREEGGFWGGLVDAFSGKKRKKAKGGDKGRDDDDDGSRRATASTQANLSADLTRSNEGAPIPGAFRDCEAGINEGKSLGECIMEGRPSDTGNKEPPMSQLHLLHEEPTTDIESPPVRGDDESSSSEGYDNFLTYLNKFQKACDVMNSPVDNNEVPYGGSDGQTSSENEEELDHIGDSEVNEDMMQRWAQDSDAQPKTAPEPPKWRFVDIMKKTSGYSSAYAGTVVEGGYKPLV